MLQYIINVPYERKEKCIEIGIQINRMEDIYTLILCYNKKKKRILFYLECDKNCIIDMYERKLISASDVFNANEFWEKLDVKEWIIYTFVEANEYHNRVMISKIFKF